MVKAVKASFVGVFGAATLTGESHKNAVLTLTDVETKKKFQVSIINPDFLDYIAQRIGSSSVTRCEVEVKVLGK